MSEEPNPRQQPKKPPVDASMTLLNEVMHRPLDPGYATAARRKAQREAAGMQNKTHPISKGVVLVVALALGFVTVTSISSLRARTSLTSNTRAVLIDEIEQRNNEIEEISQSIDRLRSETEALQAQILQATDTELEHKLQIDQMRNGNLAVTGPGLIIEMEDGADADVEPAELVQDRDLRPVITSLWGAGAEAISVNGKRLTATSAVRSAGDAILVDLIGLSSPYVIEAVGDPAMLQKNFAKQPAATHLVVLEQKYGIPSTISESKNLTLDAGTTRALISAQVPEDYDENSN
ncbi:DUF881 domain-containing protein [Timonella sp. A28]|uniref:DUF881 domain-containing protein n=1 Tax=Timonella sp. A28 TaxID=3442640 RepID=UPI003EBA1C13